MAFMIPVNHKTAVYLKKAEGSVDYKNGYKSPPLRSDFRHSLNDFRKLLTS